MPFGFNEKREEINDAHGSIVLPLTGLTMTRLALGDTTNNIGQADTYYTDNSVNTANSDMFTNYAVSNFGATPPTNENSSYFTNTFAGDPMPLRNNVSFGDFHGTCKPVALGDYIDSTSTNSALEGSFATAGLVSTGLGGFDVYVSVFKTDATVSPMVPLWECSANCGLNVSINDSDVRLFAYPGLDFSGTEKAIVVIVNDYPNSLLYFYIFKWDFGATPTTITNIASTTTASTVTDNIKYTGQHDIFYLPSSKKLFLLRKDGILEEVDIDPPGTPPISALTNLSNITAVAYNDDITTGGVFVTTDTSGTLNTYVKNITPTPASSTGSAVLSTALPTTVFDGCYNKTVDAAGFYFCAVNSGTNQLISYRFDVNLTTGALNSSNSYGTAFLTLITWTQVETQAYNVINVGVGPNNTGSVKTARLVCNSATLRPTYSEYNNSTVEDFILMRHPSGANNSINSNAASGSTHLICIDSSLTITTHGKNFLNEVENDTSTNGSTQRQQYIIYLGYCNNTSSTPVVNYLYLALASNLVVAYDQTGGIKSGGYYLYFNYDA
jgi:hypothetical protein